MPPPASPPPTPTPPAGSPAPAGTDAPPERKKLSTTAIVILVIAGVQVGPMLFFVPAMLVVFAVGDAGASDAPDPLGIQVAVLSVLATLSATALFALRNASPRRPGLPAGPRRPPYDLAGGGGLGDRLRRLPARLQSLHRGVLWGLVAAAALSALGILAAVVAGPQGPAAALFGFLLLGGWLLTLLGYVAAGYRFLAPSGAALLAYGLLLHVESVALAWGGELPGSVHAVALLAVLWTSLAPAIEANVRLRSKAWPLVTAAAAGLAAALPAVMLAGLDAPAAGRLGSGLSAAGVILGLAGGLRMARLSPAWRGGALAVAALWALASVATALLPSAGLRERMLAATVLVVLVTAIATVTAFLVQRPRGSAA